jgi:hypothetical protein
LKEEEVVKSTNTLERYRGVLQLAMTADNQYVSNYISAIASC